MMRRRRADDGAFDDIIRRNEADLLAYLRRRLPVPADAADAFGDLLLVAWRRRKRIPADAEAARMWMFVTARNVLLNSRRSSERSSAAVQRLAEALQVADPGPDDDDLRAVRDAIAALAPDDAELVRLTYWDGFASHEAAAILGINPSTARSRLSRCRLQLRDALSPSLIGGE